MHGLNWDDIRYFLAVIEAGSVTAAAVQLGVNHSTVSRRVTGFESQLGTKLFDRGPLGWAITPAGEGLLYSARGIAESVYAMRREVEGADAALKGVLRVTAPHLCFQQLLGPPLKAFSDNYPDIQVHLMTSIGSFSVSKSSPTALEANMSASCSNVLRSMVSGSNARKPDPLASRP